MKLGILSHCYERKSNLNQWLEGVANFGAKSPTTKANVREEKKYISSIIMV